MRDGYFKKFKLSGSEKIGTSSVLSLSDENGSDWYESQKLFGEDTLKVVFNESGIIVSMSYDVSALWPIDNSVAEIAADQVPDNLNIDGGWVFDGEKIVTWYPGEDEINETATDRKNQLISEARGYMAPLQDALDLKEASADETEKLLRLKKYCLELHRMDVTDSKGNWPKKPF